MSRKKKQKLFQNIKAKLSGSTSSPISPVVHVAFLVVFIGAGILYLVQVNATSTQGFKIRSLEQQVQQLEDIQKELELRQVDVSSLSVLNDKKEELELVAVERVTTLNNNGELALDR